LATEKNILDRDISPALTYAVCGGAALLFIMTAPLLGAFVNLSKASAAEAEVLSIFAAALLLGALILFSRSAGRMPASTFLLAALVTVLAMIIRGACMDFVSGDYIHFLRHWTEHFRSNGGFAAISQSVGDYNVPYLYVMALISYIPIHDMYLIKLASIVFDLLCALFIMKLAGHFTESPSKRALAWCAALMMPTFWLNSAYWAQCDAMYVFFILASLYYALKNRGILAVAMCAIAFSVKLQTIFFIPVLLVLLIAKRINWKHLLFFPGVYFATILPALVFGKPLGEILAIYGNQVVTYDDRLVLNAPTVFDFVLGDAILTPAFKYAGIATAGAFILFFLWYLWQRRDRIDDRVVLLVTAVFAVGIPWLLPSMHDRYFYLAEAVCIAVGFVYVKRFYISALVFAASYCGYHNYLMQLYLFDMKTPALIMLAALVLLIVLLIRELKPNRNSKEIQA